MVTNSFNELMQDQRKIKFAGGEVDIDDLSPAAQFEFLVGRLNWGVKAYNEKVRGMQGLSLEYPEIELFKHPDTPTVDILGKGLERTGPILQMRLTGDQIQTTLFRQTKVNELAADPYFDVNGFLVCLNVIGFPNKAIPKYLLVAQKEGLKTEDYSPISFPSR